MFQQCSDEETNKGQMRNIEHLKLSTCCTKHQNAHTQTKTYTHTHMQTHTHTHKHGDTQRERHADDSFKCLSGKEGVDIRHQVGLMKIL